ncbi:MAG: Glu-tRNA(Gln) amidotransferase subunit GatD [Kosmotogaceae bacterium]|nr:Glu-tRNA(Gln) amidotransferase subunit GatD [Kosmotogaceae bacterium]
MYPKEIQELLEKAGITEGNRVLITKDKKTYEGILMPRISQGAPENVVLKLDNGYNIGVRYEKGLKIKKMKGGYSLAYRPKKLRTRKDPKKSTITVLGGGGTIGSRVEYKTGAVFPAFSPGDLIASFPKLKQISNIKGKKLFDLFSEDMSPRLWQEMAKEVAKEIKKKRDGIVLMHGTDTMHYTSAALSFMVQRPTVPVVIVGAQRSSDRGSSDNEMNLLCGTALAANSDIAEVGICMHANMSDDYCYFHQGTKVRKLHTSRRDAFRSVNASPFAKVWYKDLKVEPIREDYKRRKDGKMVFDDKINEKVGLFYNWPGIEPSFLEGLVDFYDGIVIAGTGLGHVSTNPSNHPLAKSLVPALETLIESGVSVVMAPQTIYGRINMNVYETGRILNDIGVIGNGCDWLPETALVKLMWVLGHTKNVEKVKEMMMKNLAGEISERTKEEEYLL